MARNVEDWGENCRGDDYEGELFLGICKGIIVSKLVSKLVPKTRIPESHKVQNRTNS
jgi:hypothetical protein